MSERYTMIDRHYQPSAIFASASDAWANADFRNRANFSGAPYTVVKLVPVPRPVPPRPSVQLAGRTVTHGRIGPKPYYIGASVPCATAADVICNLSAIDALTPWPEDDTLRALLALPEQTRLWERDHGGAQP
jgi:hypothetical protein